MSEQIYETDRRPTQKNLLAGTSITAIAAFSFISPLTLNYANSQSILLAMLLFAPILGLLLALLFFEIRKRPYSLNLMHLVALLLFVGLAPMLQVARGRYPLEIKSEIDISNVVLANIGCMLWLISYAIAYHLGELRSARRTTRLDRLMLTPVSTGSAWSMLAIAPLALIWLWLIGLGGAATREAAGSALNQVGGPLQLFSGTFVRGFPYVALAIAICVFRHERRWLLLPAIVGTAIASLFVNNPMAAPRYWTVAILLGLAVPTLLQKRRTGSVLLIAAIAGLVVMPALDLGRRAESVEDVLVELRFLDLPSPAAYLAENGDLAAFSVFTLGVEWVDRFGHTWGQQILASVALFWVPRAWWVTKPISTGSQIVGDLGFDFTVISAPIMTDAYLDFGWVGIIAFGALVGFTLARLDSVYWRDSDSARIVDSFYPFLLGMMLFLTRGSLMSAFPYTVSFICCGIPLLLVPLLEKGVRQRTSARPELHS